MDKLCKAAGWPRTLAIVNCLILKNEIQFLFLLHSLFFIFISFRVFFLFTFMVLDFQPKCEESPPPTAKKKNEGILLQCKVEREAGC